MSKNSRLPSSSSSNEESNDGSLTSKRSKVEFRVSSKSRVGAAASAFQKKSSDSKGNNIWTVVDANEASGDDDDVAPARHTRSHDKE